jgi:hypothetical protein
MNDERNLGFSFTRETDCVFAAKFSVGPKLFLACPMDVGRSLIWFTDLWNYFIVPYLSEAVRQSIQVSIFSFTAINIYSIAVDNFTCRKFAESNNSDGNMKQCSGTVAADQFT